jgi:hypothetical protein
MDARVEAAGARGPRRDRVPATKEPTLAGRTEAGLRRAITPGLRLLFIVGDVLGGGIYALVGEVERRPAGRSGARSCLPC